MIHITVMNNKILLIILVSLISLNLKAQTKSRVFHKTSILGFNLCETTINDLQKHDNNFKEIIIEEMDFARGCFGQDSRFTAGKGIYSENYPGVVFQKAQDSEYISKIRLTKSFSGNLPDGKFINLKNMVLKDVFEMYPSFKKNWYSRGCSEYWGFSNDTVSFYVKIDPNKKPQFPINEAYYLNKPVEGIDLVMSCFRNSKEDEEYISSVLVSEHVYFVDSIRITKADLMKYEPSQIATLTVYKNKSSTDILGSEGVDGVIYIETKNLAKKRYWRYFKSKSKEYSKLVLQPGMEKDIAYILNGKVLQDNFEGDLSEINNTNLISIQVLDKRKLMNDFRIFDKEWGILIKSKPSPDKTLR